MATTTSPTATPSPSPSPLLATATTTTTHYHCGYCLQPIAQEAVKTCSKCHRRRYCSRDCQVLDWNDPTRGQRHQLWCGRLYGEEDEDWCVQPVTHGLGLVALRDLPPHFPLIVERGLERHQLDHHRGVRDLLPLPGTIDEKWTLNRMGTLIPDQSVLALRIARANHACDPNADHYYDEAHGLKILVTNRPIARGQEICISYTNYGDVAVQMTVEEHQEVLQRKWGIGRCPLTVADGVSPTTTATTGTAASAANATASCLCQDPLHQQQLAHGRALDYAVMDFGRAGDIAMAVAAGEELLAYHETHHGGHVALARTCYDLFQVCITTPAAYLDDGVAYLRRAYALSCQCTGPRSDSSAKYAALLQDPTQHNAYGLFA